MMGDPSRGEQLRDALRDRLMRDQKLELEQAEAVADKIAAADEDISDAAAHWVRTGELPDTPKIEGYSLRHLGMRMSPSMALTALIALRRDPQRARSALRHHARPASARRD